MIEVLITINEEKAEILQQMADYYKLSPQALITAMVDEYIDHYRENEKPTEKVNYRDLQDKTQG